MLVWLWCITLQSILKEEENRRNGYFPVYHLLSPYQFHVLVIGSLLGVYHSVFLSVLCLAGIETDLHTFCASCKLSRNTIHIGEKERTSKITAPISFSHNAMDPLLAKMY